jgi:putative ABC transport system permease protein
VLKNILKVSFLDMKRRKWDFLRLCLILSFGFSALYTTLSLKSQLISKLEDQAKFLLTSDLSISVRRAVSEKELDDFYKTLQSFGTFETTREITLLSVMSSKNTSNISLPTAVNIKWVEDKYPFYSKAKFTTSHWKQLHEGKFIFLNRDQAERLGIKKGEVVQILGLDFEVLDVIDDDTTIGSRFFSLFPIVFASIKNAPSNLFGQQTSFFESRHIKWENPLSFDSQMIVKKEIEKKLTDPALKVNLPKDSSEQNQKLWETISDFLGILTLSSLILSILGLVTLMKYQWSHEIPTHQKLFLLGFTKTERFILKIFQVNVLSIMSSLLCLSVSFPMSKMLSSYLPNDLKASMDFFHLNSFLFLFVCLVVVLNVIACYFFFLDKIRFDQFKISTLASPKTFNKTLLFSILGFVFTLLIGRYLTRSWFITLVVVLGLLVLYFILVGTINVILKISSKYFTLPRRLPFKTNYQIIIRLIYRSWIKNRTLYSMTVSCLGIVFFLLTLLMALQVSLKTQLSFSSDKPDLFLFDVQPEDIDAVNSEIQNFAAKSLALSPMVRGRLLAINDASITREDSKINATREEEEESRFKFRAVSVSYKRTISNFERIVEGDPLPETWDAKDVQNIPLSLEYRYAKRLKVKIGDSLTFEFQGQKFRGVIKNLRYVFWLSLHPNFFILFPEGVLNDLPQTYLSVLKFVDDAKMKDFIHLMQQQFNHISLLLLKQTAALVLKQVDLLLNAFLIISTLFLLLGIFLWLSVVFERMNMERTTSLLLTKLGLSKKNIQFLYIGEFMGMVLIIFILTPILSYTAAFLIASEYFDGLLVWPTGGIIGLSIILVFPLGLITYYLVGRFTRNKT